MDILFVLIGFGAVNIGFWWLVISLFRKKPKKTPSLILTGGVICVFIAIIITEPVDPIEEAEIVEKEVIAAEPTEEDKKKEEKLAAEKEKAEKEAADAKAAADKLAAEEKAAAEKLAAEKEEKEIEQLAIEKQYYLETVMPQIDEAMSIYDSIWDTYWVPTFNGVSSGQVDTFSAYSNMKDIRNLYDQLETKYYNISDDKMSEENKELITEYAREMASAARYRASAAKKAQKMFDTGDYSPSTMDKITAEVNKADRDMLNAILSLTSMEMQLGIEREY